MPLHPIIARIIHSAYAKGHGDLHLQTVNEVREHYRRSFQPPSSVSPSQDYQANDCVLRLHRPLKPQDNALPAIIHLRACGHTMGSLNDTDDFCQQLADYCQCVVVAMEPRLCPEVKFPVPVYDCLDGLHCLHEHHTELGIDPKKIGVWGESSGGCYAAGLCQLVKGQGLIQQQVLIYPALDYYTQYPSNLQYGTGFLMDNTLTNWFLKNYARDPEDYSHPLVSPALATDFSGLPPTLIIGAECDPLRDGMDVYFQKLAAANVNVNAVYFLGVTHSFLWFKRTVDTARMALYYAADHLKLRFAGLKEAQSTVNLD
ncbi:MAG: alpha/beta hydrolase [Candidatus Berkiella sp.]